MLLTGVKETGVINSMVKILSIPGRDAECYFTYLSLEFRGETQALHINSGVAGIEIKSMRINKIISRVRVDGKAREF